MDLPAEERRCLELAERRTCIALESDFWECLEDIAEQRGTTIDRLVDRIAAEVEIEDLSAALRVFVLAHFRERSGLAGSSRLSNDLAELLDRDRVPARLRHH